MHDVMTWKRIPNYWPFVRGIHRPPIDSPHRGPGMYVGPSCFLCCLPREDFEQNSHRLFEIPWRLCNTSVMRVGKDIPVMDYKYRSLLPDRTLDVHVAPRCHDFLVALSTQYNIHMCMHVAWMPSVAARGTIISTLLISMSAKSIQITQ